MPSQAVIRGTPRVAILLLAAALLLASVALHTAHFHNRNFREDEIYTVQDRKSVV